MSVDGKTGNLMMLPVWKRRLRLLCLLGAVALTACSTGGPYQLILMPAPEVYTRGIDPFADGSDVDPGPASGILYATDRLPADRPDHEPFYLNERGHELRLGAARVKLAVEGVTWEDARRISMLKNRTDKYPLQVESVEEFGILEDSITFLSDPEIVENRSDEPARIFAGLINEKLETSRKKDVYIYVHGFKVNFENPILLATELWHFLGYDGVFIAYAWPSTPSIWAYASDAETAAYSSRNLATLIAFLARETKAEHIHVIGYSQGTRVVVGSMARLALLHSNENRTKIREELRVGTVVLVGSDVDRAIFGGYVVDGMMKVPKQLANYMSSRDKALGMSSLLFGRRRMGQIRKDDLLRPQVAAYLRQHGSLAIIDVTDAEKSAAANGHAYFRDSPWVSSDILVTLMYDLPPAERGLVQPSGGQPVWTFPADYPDRLVKALEKANPELFRGELRRDKREEGD